eukprot:8668549-Pyramimonas_sp.AAC.2
MKLKHRPISRVLVSRATEQISLKVRGLSSWRQAMYRQAAWMALALRPRIDFSSAASHTNISRSGRIETVGCDLCQ